jgi:alkylhydroperoxidase family enzyme
MPRITPLPVDGNSYFRIFGHIPKVAEGWKSLDAELRFGGSLDPELKEQVRRSMAPGLGCEFCATLGGAPDDRPDPKVALAIAYAQALLDDHRDLDESLFSLLREEFSEAEIVELTFWICFMTAGQMFGAIMDVGPATDEDMAGFRTGLVAAAREHVSSPDR